MVRRIISICLCVLLLTGCASVVPFPAEPSDTSMSIQVPDTTVSCDIIPETTSATEPTETELPVITEPIVVVPTEATEAGTVESMPDDVVETVPVVQPTEPALKKTLDELVRDGTYMLVGSFGFYKGKADMSTIQSVTFSRIAPTSYDEVWNANVADTNDIRGYRVGNRVIIVGDHIYANKRCSQMFAAFDNYGSPMWSSLTEINGLDLLDTSYATNMKRMFSGCRVSSLPGIETWNVSSVTNMTMMFEKCVDLVTLDIGGWDVSNVVSFSGMFQGNNHVGDMKLQSIDVSRWNTQSAKEMNHMFYGCGLLTYIPVENFAVSGVTTFSHMFADCFSLQSLDVSKWETLSVQSFDAFLNDCRSLVSIDVSGLDTVTCIQFSQMFEACSNLTHIYGLETWDVSNASNYAFSETFHGCRNLRELNIGSWITAPDNTARMVKGCYALTYIDMSGFDMSNNQHVTEMFMDCMNLTEVVGLATWDFSNLENYDSMFSGSGLVVQEPA